jgi:alkanesulfonate monooxygenase SsuD/methylene tetrahydromethanopterin reductase-like flavin-dependent oxidoreductase (luciferase family)
MPELQFAFWDTFGVADAANPADVYDERLCLTQRLEELGWHSYFVIEHQNAPMGTSAPSVYLTAVARATSRLRFGAMMFQLPLYNPLRLAQEVATLDQLSRGRVEFGTGTGVHEHEFIRWGVDYYQRAAISQEVLHLVKMAWTRDEVTFHGKFFDFEEALPHPKPYQQPHPPIWIAAHSDATFEYAARNNYNVANNLETDDLVERKFDLYRRVWRESNHPGPMPRIFLMRGIHVAETDDKAHAEARQYLGGGDPISRVGTGPIAQTRVGWGSHQRGMGTDSEKPENKARGENMARAARDYGFNLESGLAIVGSPKTVVRRIEEQQARLGYTLLCTNHQIGRMPPDLVRNSIELFGNEVIPAFSPAMVA